jgi:hypothetical protein
MEAFQDGEIMVMVNNYFKKQAFGWLTGLPW